MPGRLRQWVPLMQIIWLKNGMVYNLCVILINLDYNYLAVPIDCLSAICPYLMFRDGVDVELTFVGSTDRPAANNSIHQMHTICRMESRASGQT